MLLNFRDAQTKQTIAVNPNFVVVVFISKTEEGEFTVINTTHHHATLTLAHGVPAFFRWSIVPKTFEPAQTVAGRSVALATSHVAPCWVERPPQPILHCRSMFALCDGSPASCPPLHRL